MKTTGIHFLTEGDDANEPASSGNVISFNRPELGDPNLLGDILAAFVLPELALRMRGNFDLPRIVAWTAGRDDSPGR